MAETETFELTLLGGAAEERYRHLRPGIEALEWEALAPHGAPAEEILAARRAWTVATLQEYATAAAHGTMLAALVTGRVPLDLSAMASRFSLDELAHAELSARVVNALGGGTPLRYDPDRLFSAASRGVLSPELEAARLVIDNCVSESWSCELLQALWQLEEQPVLRAVRTQIASDEAGHGRFGWMFLDWLLPGCGDAEREALRRMAADLVARLGASLDEAARAPESTFNAFAPMALGKAGYLALGRQGLEQRVLRPLRERGLA
jgi:hypothetical protein